jgi:hypothetical protein
MNKYMYVTVRQHTLFNRHELSAMAVVSYSIPFSVSLVLPYCCRNSLVIMHTNEYTFPAPVFPSPCSRALCKLMETELSQISIKSRNKLWIIDNVFVPVSELLSHFHSKLSTLEQSAAVLMCWTSSALVWVLSFRSVLGRRIPSVKSWFWETV